MLKQKFLMFITPFCEATPACLLVMVQGNIWLATIGHLQKAIETGFIRRWRSHSVALYPSLAEQ